MKRGVKVLSAWSSLMTTMKFGASGAAGGLGSRLRLSLIARVATTAAAATTRASKALTRAHPGPGPRARSAHHPGRTRPSVAALGSDQARRLRVADSGDQVRQSRSQGRATG